LLLLSNPTDNPEPITHLMNVDNKYLEHNLSKFVVMVMHQFPPLIWALFLRLDHGTSVDSLQKIVEALKP
jgi:hypothetical protein